jgi:hypothetical protein
LLYNAKTNGSPFAHENWRNFAFALYGNGDFGYIDTVAYRGFVDVFLQNPNLVWRLWVHNVLTMARAVALMHTSSLLLAMFLPIGFAILRQRRDAAILGMYIVACILPTVATFRYTPRLVLGATPILILIGVIGLDYVIEQLPSYTTATVQARRLGRVTIWLTLVIITGSPVARLPILVASFVERQPVEEVEVLDRLVERLSVPRDKPIKVVSTYQYLAYFSNHPEAVVQTWAPPFDERFPGSIVSMSESQDADYILVSDRTASAVVASGAFDPVVPRCWVLEEDVLVQTGSIRLLKNACA